MEAKPVTEAKFLVMAVKGPNPQVKEYKRRRHHNKNRLGCLSCRQKRAKVSTAPTVTYSWARAPRRTCIRRLITPVMN
jgi:hypothetical protein